MKYNVVSTVADSKFQNQLMNLRGKLPAAISLAMFCCHNLKTRLFVDLCEDDNDADDDDDS